MPLPQLALAYERWGHAFAERLSGDFVIAIADEYAREILFIRDPLGICPFYYSSNGKALFFATEQRFIHEPGDAVLNDGFAAEWLSGNILSRSETIFRKVQRLPPGSTLRVKDGRIVVQRYWYPERSPELKTADGRELEERFTVLLTQAVTRRIVPDETASELSGGLDSSTVACLARKSGLVKKAYTLAFTDPACDEQTHADAVAKFAGLDLRSIQARDVALDSLREYIRRHHALPLHPTSAVSLSMLSAMRSDGVSVALSGQGGDDLLTGSTHYPADLFTQLRWIELFLQSRSGPQPPGFVRYVRRAIATILHARGWRKDTRDLGCVSDDLSRSSNLVERLRPPEPPEKWHDYCRKDLFRELSGGFVTLSLEEQAVVYGQCGLDGRHPFYDRDLYEFSVMLPEHERQRGRVGKQILRRAMKDIVPNSVLARTDKAEFSAVLEHVLAEAESAGLFTFAALRERNWIDSRASSSLLEDYRHQQRAPDGRKGSVLNRVWTLLALELFLQELPHLSRCKEMQDAAHVRQEDVLNARA